jgi:hypothetical protein
MYIAGNMCVLMVVPTVSDGVEKVSKVLGRFATCRYGTRVRNENGSRLIDDAYREMTLGLQVLMKIEKKTTMIK